MNQSALSRIEEIIKQASDDEKRQLLVCLPEILKKDVKDMALLQVAESSFSFWDNEEDAVYDSL